MFEVLSNAERGLIKRSQGYPFPGIDLRVFNPSQLYKKNHTTRSQGYPVDDCNLDRMQGYKGVLAELPDLELLGPSPKKFPGKMRSHKSKGILNLPKTLRGP